MSKLMRDFEIAVLAAFVDTVKNIFRPVHNAKVILGIEHEKSISEIIKEAGKNSRKPNISTPAVS